MQDLMSTGIIVGILLIVFAMILLCVAMYIIVSSRKKGQTITESVDSRILEPISVIDNNNDELIAVISAAVAAYLSDTSVETVPLMRTDTKFKVVSFRKVR